MDTLNYDCIDYLFDYLDLRSKVNFALASKQCCEHFERWAERRLKVVNKRDLERLSENEIKSLIRVAGQFIENVELCGDFLPEIVEFCINLKHLHISLSYKRSFETQIPTLAMIKTLESLHYDVEAVWNKTLENLIKTIAELPKLKELCLNAEGYEGKYLKDLKHIETLELISFKYLEYEHLEEFFASTKTLRNLYLREGREFQVFIDKRTFQAIALCQSLENIFLLNTDGYEDLPNIPNLKGLYMASKEFECWDSLLYTLAKNKQLEALSLFPISLTKEEAATIGCKTKLKQLFCGLFEPVSLERMNKLKDLEYFECQCNKISDNDLLKIISTYPKLYYFGTESLLLTNKFVPKLVEILKQDDSQKRSSKLHIGLHHSVLKEIKKTVYDAEYIKYFNIIDANLGRKRNYLMNSFYQKYKHSTTIGNTRHAYF